MCDAIQVMMYGCTHGWEGVIDPQWGVWLVGEVCLHSCIISAGELICYPDKEFTSLLSPPLQPSPAPSPLFSPPPRRLQPPGFQDLLLVSLLLPSYHSRALSPVVSPTLAFFGNRAESRITSSWDLSPLTPLPRWLATHLELSMWTPR